LQRRFRSVDIIPVEGDRLGAVKGYVLPKHLRDAFEFGSPAPRHYRQMEDHVMILCAGDLAVKKLTGRSNHVGASDDYRQCTDLALRVCHRGDEASAWWKWLRLRTSNLLNDEGIWNAVEAVAAALLERRHLSAEEARRIYTAARWPGLPDFAATD